MLCSLYRMDMDMDMDGGCKVFSLVLFSCVKKVV